MLPEEIKKLQDLHEQGALTDEEFEAAKGQLIKTDRLTSKSQDLMGLDLPNYLALMHASQFAGFILPFAGLIAPIVLWSIAKDKYPEVAIEGKYIFNWMISELIYFTIAFVLCFVLIGFVLMIPLVIASVVLPLIGTIEATQGKSYKYPMAIDLSNNPKTMIADELQKLRDLYEQGAIDAAEYVQIKQRLLNTNRPAPEALLGLSLNSYNALLHSSQYLGYVLPYIGLVLSFVLWLRVRDRYPTVDAHGKCAVNWIITELIFTTIVGLLGVGWFFFGTAAGYVAQQQNGPIAMIIWLVGLFVLGGACGMVKLLGTIFPLIAAVRALDGKTFQYPFAIRFLK